jgi:hypothetical protein
MRLITEFKEFLTDSLLLEANIKFSNEFRNFLMDINDDISYKLLNNVEDREIKTQINYIEPDLKNSSNIKFYPDSKVKSNFTVNYQYSQYRGDTALRLLKYVDLPDKNIIMDYFENHMKNDTAPMLPIGTIVDTLYVVDKLSVSKEFDMNYGNNITLVKSGDDKYIFIDDRFLLKDIDKSSTKPAEIRIGRAIKQLLKGAGVEKSDADIEKFVNKWKSRIKYEVDKFDFFKLVKGDDIRKWYHEDKYKKDGGTLNGSCMRHSSCQKYFDIYTKNPDVCQLLILVDDTDRLTGRALVWKLRDGETFMDRIYSTNDSDVDLFKSYAIKEGWYYKGSQNNDPDETIIAPKGEKNISNLFVDLDTDFKYYPYMDTLRYLSKSGGYITNCYDDYYLKLDDTEGTYRCPECNGYGDIRCPECDGDGHIECDECDGDGRIDCENCTNGRVDCTGCDGSGNITDGDEELECDECDGHGYVDCPECDGDGDTRCGSCSGRGNHNCPDCGGEGRIDCPSCG